MKKKSNIKATKDDLIEISSGKKIMSPPYPIVMRPCPFCGNRKPKVIKSGANYHKGVECKCGINIYFFKNGLNVGLGAEAKGKSEVIKAWNVRADV